jgi:hypothetical protein
MPFLKPLRLVIFLFHSFNRTDIFFLQTIYFIYVIVKVQRTNAAEAHWKSYCTKVVRKQAGGKAYWEKNYLLSN